MSPVVIRGYGGERVEVGYSDQHGDYYVQVWDHYNDQPIHAETCASVIDVVAATQGQVDWQRHRLVLRDLVLAGGRAKTEATRTLVSALAG